MPRRRSDKQKQADGTFRADRQTAVMPLEAAQAALTAAILELEAAKALATSGTAPAGARRRARKRVAGVLPDNVSIAMEQLQRSQAAQAAQDAAPSIREGLELMSYDCLNAEPPLSDSEQIEWLHVGPHSTIDLAQRKVAAGVPLTADEQSWMSGLTKRN